MNQLEQCKHRPTSAHPVDRHPRRMRVRQIRDDRLTTETLHHKVDRRHCHFIGRNEMEGSKETPGEGQAGLLAGFGELDRILRGELTQVSSLRRGGIDVSPGRLSLIIVVLGMVYGICMGTFALFRMKGPHALADRREHGQGPAALLPDAARHFAVALCLQRPGRLAADAGARSCACWWRRWG